MTDCKDIVIQTEGLGCRFGRHWAVRGLDLSVPRGAVYGFLGPNGAGKSTTIKMLMGLVTPHEGSASVLGFNPRINDIDVKKRVGYVAESPNFYEWMTIEEIVAFVAHYRPDAWDDARAKHLMEVFRLPSAQRIDTLSKGQKAHVSLLLAMAFNPEVLILDEPTGGLDPMARRRFIEGVLGEFMQGDQTILVSSHLINETSGVVDHIGVISEGGMIRSEKTEELLSKLKRIRLGFDAEDRAVLPEGFQLEGLRRFETSGRELILVIDGYRDETQGAALRELAPARFDVDDLSLEDAFIEIVAEDGSASVATPNGHHPGNREVAS